MFSYFSFFTTLLNVYHNYCPLTFLVMLTNSSSLFTNIISSLVIALIRYYLLVMTKQENEESVISWFKVKIASLMMNCGLLSLTLISRGILMFLNFTAHNTLVPLIIFDIVLTIVILIATLMVYCKMDIDLKSQKVAETIEKKITKDDDIIENHSISSKPSTKRSNEEDIITKYGGIYTGEQISEAQSRNMVRETRMNAADSTSQNEDANSCLAIQERSMDIVVIHRAEVNCSENQLKSHSSESIIQNCILPNTVLNEEAGLSTDIAISSVPDATQLRNNIQEGTSHDKNNKKTLLVDCTSENREENHIERINVIEGSVISEPASNVVLPFESDEASEIIEEYKDSKERRSIIKSVVISAMYFLLIVVSVIIIQIIYRYEKIGFIFASLYVMLSKLFRSFAVIITSVYCFELVHALFLEIIADMKEFVENMYFNITHVVDRN